MSLVFLLSLCGCGSGETKTGGPLQDVASQVVYVNYYSAPDQRLFTDSLNLNERPAIGSSPRRLPLYRFTSRQELEAFRDAFGKDLTFDHGKTIDSASFNEAAERYDDAFFAQNTLLLAYVEASSGMLRFGLDSVTINDGSCVVYVKQTNDTQGAATADMAGWFVLAELPEQIVRDCTAYDAIMK